MPEPTFSPGDPFGGQPPWLGIPSPAALERLDAVLASDWELQPDLWAADPALDRTWAELLLAALERHGRLDQADAVLIALRRRGMQQLPQPQPPVLRSVHHLACTGGTLISKVIASLPGVALISEVNPLNRNSAGFHPSNPLLLLEQAWRPLRPDQIRPAFQAEISQALRICADADHTLVLRDHSHSDFCRGSEPQRDVLLLSWLRPHHRFRPLRTLRHPLDSWLALVHAGWHTQFQPSTLLEYCRRQQAFLDATDAMPQLHYEDFCTAPLSGLEQICDALLLPFDPTALERFGNVHLSGDSGRRNTERIEPRPRRAIPESIQAELADPATHQALGSLCDRMGYAEASTNLQ